MTDGGQDFDLGQVVGSAGEKGDDGSTVWNTSTAPTYANSKYTFNISNLSGKTGLQIAVNDIIFYSTYYYIVSNVNSTAVDCSTRVSIKGSDASVTIVDNLTSTSSTSALSAKQGKVLNDNKIETSSIATSFGSTPSDTKVPSEKLTKNTLDNKVDKVTGKGLSTNDFTNSYKNTIDGLSTVATTGDYDDLTDKPSIPSSSSDLSDGSNIVKKSSTSGLLKNDGTVDTTSYSTFSGSYDDLSGKPTIPTKTSDLTNDGDGTNVFVKNNDSRLTDARTPTSHTHTKSQITDFPTIPSKISDLTNDSDFIETSSTEGVIANDGSIIGIGTTQGTVAAGNHTHSNYISGTKVTSWSGSVSDSNIPSEKLVKNTLDDKISKSSTAGLIKNDGSVDTNTYLTSSSLSNYVQKSSTSGLIKNDGTIMTSGTGSTNYAAGNHTHSSYVSGTKVTSWQSTPSDSNIPSEKLVSDTFAAIEDLIGDAITYINQ